MKRLVAIMLLLHTLNSHAADLQIELQTPDIKGAALRLSLFESPHGFPMGQPLRAEEKPLSGPLMQVCLKDLAPGIYAIAVYVDTNGNRQLDKNWLGIPREPFGFSKDALGLAGPPSFQQAAFVVKDGTNLHTVHLRK